MPNQEYSIVVAQCSSCLRETKHRVLAERKQYGGDGYDRPRWVETYEMLECCGCDAVAFRRRLWREDHVGFDPATGKISRGLEEQYFPPALSRRKPDWLAKLDPKLQALMDEVYAALHADLRALAVMGARAVLDIVMQDKVGNAGSFSNKLTALVAQGFVSVHDKGILEVALEAGHAAAHRGEAPDPSDLKLVMDIVEHLLQAIYILRPAAAKLKVETPQRPKASG